jgi:predicted RNase H-like nuclease (RuvC/YqgF family)
MTSIHAAERFALVTLRDMIANLEAHIDHRAAEIAAPRIDEAREAEAAGVERAQREQRRAEDLVAELRRHISALERRRDEQRQRAEQAEADLARLRAGESAEPAAPHVTLTPAEWIRKFNDATPEERLRVVEVLLEGAARGSRCFQLDHEGVIEMFQAELTRLRL